MNKFMITIGIIGIFVISFLIFWINSPRFLPADLSESEFCWDKGFDGDSNTDRYMKYKGKDYGMVECGSCYVEGCEWFEFNVTKDWRGNLHLVENDALGRVDE